MLSIISASRRTDIPAFYADWFINRIRAGYCLVSNPYNANQISRVSLLPHDVDAIVFWTRNPRPLFPFLRELDSLGYHYFFHFTMLNNPRSLDPKSPSLGSAVTTFRELSHCLGPDRVIWRYDPIILSNMTDTQFHIDAFRKIAGRLEGYTTRVVVSLLTLYRHVAQRLRKLEKSGLQLMKGDVLEEQSRILLRSIADIAETNGMQVLSCSMKSAFGRFGIRPGKCIDDEYLQDTFGVQVSSQKDPGQRPECRCVKSQDIGAYDTCVFGCTYCYAVRSFRLAERNYAAHDPTAASLLSCNPTDSASKTKELSLFTGRGPTIADQGDTRWAQVNREDSSM